jgi:hypothetical protein
MNKKLCTVVILFMFLTAGVIVAPATGTHPSDAVRQHIALQRIQPLQPQDDSYDEAEVEVLLNSVTLGSIIEQIKEHVRQRISNLYYKGLFTTCIADGVNELKTFGITSDMTLKEVDDALQTGLFNRKSDRYLPFMINVLPTFAIVSTMLEPMVFNLTEDSPSDILYYKVELFVKIIPFLDLIITEQVGLLRSLTQSTFLWPAAGGRLMLGKFTIALLAFGPRIHWTRL